MRFVTLTTPIGVGVLTLGPFDLRTAMKKAVEMKKRGCPEVLLTDTKTGISVEIERLMTGYAK